MTSLKDVGQIEEYRKSIKSETHLYILCKLTSEWHGNTQSQIGPHARKSSLDFQFQVILTGIYVFQLNTDAMDQ